MGHITIHQNQVIGAPLVAVGVHIFLHFVKGLLTFARLVNDLIAITELNRVFQDYLGGVNIKMLVIDNQNSFLVVNLLLFSMHVSHVLNLRVLDIVEVNKSLGGLPLVK